MEYVDRSVSSWQSGANTSFEYHARVREECGKYTCCLDARYSYNKKFAGVTAGCIKDTFEEAKETVLEWFREKGGDCAHVD
jgi:hypothetical protein